MSIVINYYQPMNKEEKLAREIATTLNDMHALQMHLSFCKRYSEKHLREILNRVMAMPEDKIRTSRARLYTSLVLRHES